MVEADGRFQVAEETVEKGVGHEEDQPESGEGDRMVVEIVVGVPLVDQFVEAFIFDSPAFVTETDDRAGWNFT